MPLEVFLWIAGILIPFAVIWCVAMVLLLRNMKRTGDELMAMHKQAGIGNYNSIAIIRKVNHIEEVSDELLTMHKDANGFGFGTVGLGENFRDARSTQKQLVHYLKWFVEKQVGEEPPPLLDEE